MKKTLFYALALCMGLVFSNNTAKAGVGCVIDTSSCQSLNTFGYGKICPGTLATAAAGTTYSAQNTFQLPKNFSLNTTALGLSFGTIAVTITKVVVTVSGLPRGLNYNLDIANGQYNPNNNPAGCMLVEGIPCDTAGTYNVTVNFVVTASLQGLNITLPFPLVNVMPLTLTSPYPALVLTEPYKHICLTGSSANEVTVHATSGFGTYAWTGGSTDDSLLVTAAGRYQVTVTTADNQCVFNDSVEIGALQAHTNADTSICKGSYLQLVGSGGDTYSWSPSTYLSATNIANPVVLRTDTAGSTAYQVVVSNGFCSDSTTIHVSTHICAGACTCDTCFVSTGCTGSTPKLCSTFPDVNTGTPYSQSIQFYLPATVSLSSLLPVPITIPGLPSQFSLDNAQVVVDSLPAGLDWSTDQSGNNNKYIPTLDPSFQHGCLKVCGTTCGPVGNNYMKVSIMVELPKVLKDVVKALKLQPLLVAFIGNIDTIVAIPLTGSLSVIAGTPLVISPAGNVTINPGDSVALHCNLGSNYVSYAWAGGSTADSLVVDTSGTYCATVSDSAGCSQTACKLVTVLEGINNIALSASLSIYPNPNDGIFNVAFTLKNSESVTAQVFDVAGKAVYQNTYTGITGKNNLPINLNGVAKGIYVVKLTTAEGTANRKVTVK